MSVLAENRKARFDYEISETIEAGVKLLGFEVKSAKAGRMQLPGSYAIIRGGEAYLVNATIPAFQPKNAPADYDPTRARKLLLHKKEIARLAGLLEDKKYLVPLNARLNHGLIKLELGLGRHRKKSDKREVIKKRAHQREMRGAGETTL
ncbi:MAG: SsrA-binding protein SmpB [Candidatus Liptonbacteria bacterium]|nr:SsrA-binding protein SmpB [Candidatus Liptonbacteria bacterium]